MPEFYDRTAILPQLQGIQDRGAVNPAPTAAGLPGVAERGEYSDFYDRQAPLPDFFQRGDYGDAPQIGGYDDELERATYDRGYNLFSPQHQQSRDDLTRNLANRGISIDSDAYRSAVDRLDQSQGLDRENLALSSVQAARDEAARRFNQEKSLREMLFGEDTTRGGEAARDRAQLFGEETTLGDEASRERAQLFGEDTARVSESLAQRQLYGDEAARTWSQNLAGRQQMSNEDIARAQQALQNRGQLFGEETTQGAEALARRSQLFGEDSDIYQQHLAGLGLRGDENEGFRRLAAERAKAAAMVQAAQGAGGGCGVETGRHQFAHQTTQAQLGREYGTAQQQAQIGFGREGLSATERLAQSRLDQQSQQFGQTLAEQQAGGSSPGTVRAATRTAEPTIRADACGTGGCPAAVGRTVQQQFGAQQTQFGQTLAEQQAAREQAGDIFGQQLGQQQTQFGQTLAEQEAARLQQQQQFGSAARSTGATVRRAARSTRPAAIRHEHRAGPRAVGATAHSRGAGQHDSAAADSGADAHRADGQQRQPVLRRPTGEKPTPKRHLGRRRRLTRGVI